MPPEHDGSSGRSGKAAGRTPEMHDMEKSDESVVLTKSPNEGRRTAARQAEEVVEGRDSTKGNTGEQNVPRTQRRTSTHSALERVRQAAKKDKEMKFTALFHHVTIDRLRGAYKSLKKDAAPGVDGVTWWQYGKRLEDNLRDLHDRLHRGAYRAKPTRRVYIPKPDAPLLANIYLHYVLDLWAHQWRKRHAKGDLVIVRYADDFVMGFQDEADARRFQLELRERLCKFGLELHEDKTRLLRFGRFAAEQRRRLGEGKPETFEFLGFPHICGRSSRGRFLLIRQSSAKRMRSKLAQIKRELRARMHDSTVSQGAWLRQVMNGWFAYHSIPANKRKLDAFKTAATKLWRQALRRRSQTNPDLWAKIDRLEKRWLPRPTIRHPWPWDRFDAMTRGRSRVR